MKTRLLISLSMIFLITFFTAGCSGPDGSGWDIEPDELLALVDGSDPTPHKLVDVRTADEYSGTDTESPGHIPTAENIVVDVIEGWDAAAAAGWFADKDELIVVYCKAGGRAARAKTTLETLGYTDVRNFGGISRWTAEGWNTVKGGAPGTPADL